MNRQTSITPQDRQGLAHRAHVGQQMNAAAAASLFADYQSRRAPRTVLRQGQDLAAFADFLAVVNIHTSGDALQNDPAAWQGMTWGIVEGFRRWQLRAGYAVGTINLRLSTVRTYAALAHKAGVLDDTEAALIRTVQGYSHKEARRVDEHRAEADQVARIGFKKPRGIVFPRDAVQALKTQHPDTPQGRRDKLLLCLLLDQGLRVGEVAALQVSSVNLADGKLRFYRSKVSLEAELEVRRGFPTLWAALTAYMAQDAPAVGPLLRASVSKRAGKMAWQQGDLVHVGMSERAITKRVRHLAELLCNISGASAHDCRHSWATWQARGGIDPLRLQEWGGWSSLTMPRRYVEWAKVANEGTSELT